MWFSFPIRPLLHSDDGWSGCFSLLCHSRPWGTSSPQRQRLVPGLQLRWPLIHPQWCLNGVGSVVGRRHIYSSGVSDELWGSVLWGGDFGRMTWWKAVWCESSERSAGGLWFCVRGCRWLLRHRSGTLFPPRRSLKAWRGLQLSD